MSKLLDVLHQLVPSSRCIIRSPFHLTADSLWDALLAVGLEMPLKRMTDPDFTDWDLANWDDEQIAEVVFKGHWDFHQGPLFIHAPGSRGDLMDYECRASDLREFIQSFDHGMLFGWDALFLAPESRTVTIFHHEGAFGHPILPHFPSESGARSE